jgi:hypothetical protein
MWRRRQGGDIRAAKVEGGETWAAKVREVKYGLQRSREVVRR